LKVSLTGFMGAGKTATGRALAARLGVPFLDLDDEVERAADRTIRALFEEEGEAGFRRREHAALARLLQRPGLDRFVLATGGGTMAQGEPARLLLAATRTVWLRVPLATVLRRLGAEEVRRRPLFLDEAAVRRLYAARTAAYARCELAVDVAADETADEVAARVERWLRGEEPAARRGG
jgi:shikimate kinase